VLLFDRELRYIAADGAELFASLGLGREEIEGKTVGELALPENRETMEGYYRAALGGTPTEVEIVRSGRILQTRIAPVWNDDESIAGGIALVQDVTEEREQAESVRRAKSLFEATIAAVRDGVVVLDAQYRVLYANSAYIELLDFDAAKVVGATRDDFIAHVS